MGVDLGFAPRGRNLELVRRWREGGGGKEVGEQTQFSWGKEGEGREEDGGGIDDMAGNKGKKRRGGP